MRPATRERALIRRAAYPPAKPSSVTAITLGRTIFGFMPGPSARYSPAMAEPFICMLCDKTEAECKCDRYCAMCQGEHDVRLVQDGQYLCRDCREACDMQAQI